MQPLRKHTGKDQAVARLVPGTCGELVQGCIDGRDFLVNCPVDLYARAVVKPVRGQGLQVPAGHGKIARALEAVSRMWKVHVRHRVAVESDIPPVPGMAPDTAETTAAVEAFCRSAGIALDDAQLARVLAEVEPSDCVHVRGIAHVNPLTGELFEVLPAPQGLRVLVVDGSAEVDAAAFDREKARAVYRDNAPRVRAALDLLKLGLRTGNLRAVGAAATISAELGQQILFRPSFRKLLDAALAQGALGINCAHSGTVLGVLYREADRVGDGLRRLVETGFRSSLRLLGDHRVIAGGRFAAT